MWLGDGFEALQHAEGASTIVDQLPGALEFRIDLALAVAGASAGTIEQALGATRS